jgi:HicB_like antitoxin of bacterial toxin-antitoxin system
MKYTVILQRESGGGYVAVVPVLTGCVSQGDTRADALKNIEEAIELHLSYTSKMCATPVNHPGRVRPRVRRSYSSHAMTKLPTDLSGRDLIRIASGNSSLHSPRSGADYR